jgi:hypothetical protein
MRRVECALSSRVVREPYPHTVWSYRLECQHLADSDTEGRSHVACPVCLVDDRAPPPVSGHSSAPPKASDTIPSAEYVDDDGPVLVRSLTEMVAEIERTRR